MHSELNSQIVGSLTSLDRPCPVTGFGKAPWRQGRVWVLAVAIATGLGLFSAFLAYRFTLAVGHDGRFWRSLLMLNVGYWYIWAAFAPVIVWLAQRFRFERQGWRLSLAVHGLAVTVFSLAHLTAVEAFRMWVFRNELPLDYSWPQEAARSVLKNFDWEMMTYWAIVGVSQAVFYHKEALQRRLQQAQLETKLVEAQLQTLQQQLHPHFLFNTLHAISTLMHRDVDAADRTLSRLSDLLRLTLQSVGLQQVPLKQELEFLEKYLQIEQTRFQDRLTVRFDIQPEALDALVPNLLLQPLVENAVRHGIAPKSGPGVIEIAARQEREKLWIEVRDNGVGLTQDSLTALQGGIGLSTTRARLQHHFGADYRFEFHRRSNGLMVRIVIPWGLDPGATDSRALGAA